jgi:uncharacterized protein (TIGR02421 family)
MSAEVSAAAAHADAELAAIAGAFDYLLYVSPTDSDRAWERFADAGFEEEPRFAYRELDLDHVDLRRRLGEVGTGEIGDPAVARLLEGKRQELLGDLDLITARGTDDFLRHSIALSGTVDDDLAALADEVMSWAGEAPDDPAATVSPHTFAARAQDELAAYRRQDPDLSATVHLRDDIVALMVSRDQLFVPEGRYLSPVRVEALIHHEVGVHVLTWWNGHVQPLQMLADGLRGYTETQEGLGVLAELLSGGLTAERLAELAARVIAARSVIDGATFRQTFAHLHHERGLPAPRAFGLAERVHRGGGLVKDAGYLRGLVRLIEHLQAGGDLDPLLVGKPALDDVGDVAALLDRGVLEPPRLRPHWLEHPCAARLEQLRDATDAGAVLLP